MILQRSPASAVFVFVFPIVHAAASHLQQVPRVLVPVPVPVPVLVEQVLTLKVQPTTSVEITLKLCNNARFA
jgi:hypothetical protein